MSKYNDCMVLLDPTSHTHGHSVLKHCWNSHLPFYILVRLCFVNDSLINNHIWAIWHQISCFVLPVWPWIYLNPPLDVLRWEVPQRAAAVLHVKGFIAATCFSYLNRKWPHCSNLTWSCWEEELRSEKYPRLDVIYCMSRCLTDTIVKTELYFNVL